MRCSSSPAAAPRRRAASGAKPHPKEAALLLCFSQWNRMEQNLCRRNPIFVALHELNGTLPFAAENGTVPFSAILRYGLSRCGVRVARQQHPERRIGERSEAPPQRSCSFVVLQCCCLFVGPAFGRAGCGIAAAATTAGNPVRRIGERSEAPTAAAGAKRAKF